uniref:Ryanodine receptor 2b (cardiac) n=1 Tax=Labrus bergylta TaxID=56723 RepID=A0A3Q3G9P9_9LABR
GMNLRQVFLSPAHEELVNLLAENDHNVWARERIKQGWTYGAQQDVKAKRSPYLVPYSLLDERRRRVSMESLKETVCTLLAYGYSLETLNHKTSKSQSPKGRVFRPDKSYAVTQGKWYFEFEIVTAGKMRVGWARPDCTPDKELGSDDQAFVFDGFEAQWYHQGVEPLGRPWQRGDVVGCLVDMAECTMMVTLNGEMLFNDRGSELAAKDFDVRDGCVEVNQVGRLNLGRQVDSLQYFTVCGQQEGYDPFAANMSRDPALWMSWKPLHISPTYSPPVLLLMRPWKHQGLSCPLQSRGPIPDASCHPESPPPWATPLCILPAADSGDRLFEFMQLTTGFGN